MYTLCIRTATRLFAFCWLILLFTACSAGSATSIPMGTMLFASHSTVNVFTAAWSPDGTHLVLGNADGSMQVRDGSTGKILVTLHGHRGHVWAVAWSPDGKRFASASWDKTVQVWDAATGKHLLTYAGHTDLVLAVAWSPDGTRIASGGSDNTVRSEEHT